MALIAEVASCTERLAKFFPSLAAMRIAVQVQSLRSGQRKVQEKTVVEYAAPQYAIFLSQLPLEFDERVKIAREGQREGVEAAVVALQYHEGQKAVAVRFLDGSCKWMMEP